MCYKPVQINIIEVSMVASIGGMIIQSNLNIYCLSNARKSLINKVLNHHSASVSLSAWSVLLVNQVEHNFLLRAK